MFKISLAAMRRPPFCANPRRLWRGHRGKPCKCARAFTRGHLGLNGILAGAHGGQRFIQQFVQLPAQQPGALADNIARAARRKALIPNFFSGWKAPYLYSFSTAHARSRTNQARQFVCGKQHLFPSGARALRRCTRPSRGCTQRAPALHLRQFRPAARALFAVFVGPHLKSTS